MASIIPFGTITVGAGTGSFCSSTFFGPEIDVNNPPPVHAIYFQAINGMTGVISIKYATKVIATLMTPNATGALPEHWVKVYGNNQILIDIKHAPRRSSAPMARGTPSPINATPTVCWPGCR